MGEMCHKKLKGETASVVPGELRKNKKNKKGRKKAKRRPSWWQVVASGIVALWHISEAMIKPRLSRKATQEFVSRSWPFVI